MANPISPIALFLLLLAPSVLAGHDYGQALTKSILFFEAQRSGYLPHNQRVNWRANSGLQDGKASGVNPLKPCLVTQKNRSGNLIWGFCLFVVGGSGRRILRRR